MNAKTSPKPSNNPNGKPVNSAIDLLPGVCWVRASQQLCRLSFAEMERAYSGQDFPKKAAGGYDQPYLPSRVAAGKKALSASRPQHRALLLGMEKAHPGSLAIYESFTWDEIRLAGGRTPRRGMSSTRINSAGLKQFAAEDIEEQTKDRLVLTQAGLLKVAENWKHVDALGLMLMQRRLRPGLSSNIVWIALLRRWLGNATRQIFALRMNRAILFEAVELAYPEVAPLAGPNGVRAFMSPSDLLLELANLCSPPQSTRHVWNQQLLDLTLKQCNC